jgi:uncharacterized protein
MRAAIRVRPGSGRTLVGGRYDDALVVRVRERAVDGRATESALRALAEALGVRRAGIGLVTGAGSRTKIVEFDDAAADEFLRLRDS